MDVDGTLTDGKIYMTSEGEYMKAFNVKDGYGIKKLKKNGIVPAIITGRKSIILEKRCEELGIIEVLQGVEDKLEALVALITKYNVKLEEIAYIGDDENDLECIKQCGVSGCPKDAIDEVLACTDYVANRDGGEGAVREFADWILRKYNLE